MISPVTYAELAPVFDGEAAREELFLYQLQVSWLEAWSQAETLAAHSGWHRCVHARRLRRVSKRPIANVLSGAFAQQFDGLLTRSESDFRSVFPDLRVRSP